MKPSMRLSMRSLRPVSFDRAIGPSSEGDGLAFDEVVGPDVVRTLWPETDAGPVLQPEPVPLWLRLWNLQLRQANRPRDALRADQDPISTWHGTGVFCGGVAPILTKSTTTRRIS